MKIAACVILYEPPEHIAANINSYIDFIDKLYIIDNTENKNRDYQFLSGDHSEIVFIHDGNNEGISKRLNQACTLALMSGFDYLLTMDQDSHFSEAAISFYKRCVEDYANKDKVSMFGINHEEQSSQMNCIHEKSRLLITSGSIINLNVYKNVGDFDENLFIDFVDIEYCFRSILKGYNIISFPHIFLHHKLGETLEKRSLKTLQKTKRTFHSPVRLYYMARNFLYVRSKYKNEFKEELARQKKDVLIRIKNNLLYTSFSTFIKTLGLLLKAWKDFKNKKMGKMNQ